MTNNPGKLYLHAFPACVRVRRRFSVEHADFIGLTYETNQREERRSKERLRADECRSSLVRLQHYCWIYFWFYAVNSRSRCEP